MTKIYGWRQFSDMVCSRKRSQNLNMVGQGGIFLKNRLKNNTHTMTSCPGISQIQEINKSYPRTTGQHGLCAPMKSTWD